MKPWHRWIIFLIVLVAVIGIVIFKSNPQRPDKTAELVDNASADEAICDTIGVTSNLVSNQSELTSEKKRDAIPRLLELGSVGCKPCQMMAPIIEELKEEYAGRLSVEFYDVREDPAPARQYGIRIIPTQIFIDSEGNEIFRHEGYLPKEEILPVLAKMGVAE